MHCIFFTFVDKKKPYQFKWSQESGCSFLPAKRAIVQVGSKFDVRPVSVRRLSVVRVTPLSECPGPKTWSISLLFHHFLGQLNGLSTSRSAFVLGYFWAKITQKLTKTQRTSRSAQAISRTLKLLKAMIFVVCFVEISPKQVWIPQQPKYFFRLLH